MSDWRQWLSPQPTEVDGLLRIVYRNGAYIGEAIKDVDGYWKYSFTGRSGFWEASHLEMVAAMLNDFNRDWDEEVRKWFDEQGT